MLLAALLSATLTVQDYATMPQVSSPRWSPDGTRIAYVLTKADLDRSAYDSDVWIVNADGTNDRQLTRAASSETHPQWSPDGKQLAFLSDRSGRNAIYIINVDGGEARQLSNEPTPVRELEWSPDGKEIAFTRIDEPTLDDERRARDRDDARVLDENPKHVHLYIANVETGAVGRLTRGDFSIWNFSWSPDGSAIAFDHAGRMSLDGLYASDIYTVTRDGALHALVVRPSIDRGPVFSPDGRWIAFTSSGGNPDWLAEHDVYVVPASGGAARMISKAYARTADRIAWSADSQSVFAEGPWATTTQIFRLGIDGTSFTNTTNVEGSASDMDMHRDRAAYIYQSLTEPPELFVDKHQLTHHNDAYRNATLGATRVIRWKNPKDGLEIEGLLTLPVNYKQGTRVPLLTFVHGGPGSRFEQEFLGYLGHVYAPQALAAEGFAVLRPNPRGSNGYGAAFRQANRADWGGMDWLDVNAGIDKVIADGIADPKRLGLMGWSYGGYLGAWSLSHSERFAAVSIGAAMTDLLTMQWTSDVRGFLPAYFPGLPLDTLRTHSPAWTLTKKPRAAVLIQHGENDERVPITQDVLLYRILKSLGTDVTMVVYPRSLHTAREPKLRMDVARRNVEFFKKNIARTLAPQ
ncbi:MAG TPA: S9 family peptidase [Thermoanaerobaculia bacterium]|nr:S9 family peptidase [Thermoanaerobaculia bacterium]